MSRGASLFRRHLRTVQMLPRLARNNWPLDGQKGVSFCEVSELFTVSAVKISHSRLPEGPKGQIQSGTAMPNARPANQPPHTRQDNPFWRSPKKLYVRGERNRVRQIRMDGHRRHLMPSSLGYLLLFSCRRHTRYDRPEMRGVAADEHQVKFVLVVLPPANSIRDEWSTRDASATDSRSLPYAVLAMAQPCARIETHWLRR